MSRGGVGVRGIRRGSRAALGLAAVLLALTLAAPAGRAEGATAGARFTYELCDPALPGGNPPAFGHFGSAAFGAFQACWEPGGWIGLIQGEPAAGGSATLSVVVPETPGGFVEAEAINALGAGIEPSGPLGGSFVYEYGFPGATSPAERIVHLREAALLHGSNGGDLELVMSCDANLGGCPKTGPAVGVRYIAATEVDPNPPNVSAPGGSILAGGVVRGHQTLSGTAQDLGGGLTRIFAVVNGQSAGAPEVLPCDVAQVDNPSVVGTVAAEPSPCPATASFEATLDTEAAPFREGANTVALCAEDFATIGEPNESCSPPRSVEVDNSCAPSAIEGGAELSAGFAPDGSVKETVAYGHGAEVVGRLTDGSGGGVAGATLCVAVATIGVDAAPMPATTVSTDAAGRFSYRLAPGPNREVVIGYRHDSGQLEAAVRLRSHVRPKLALSARELRNGGRLRFRGRLPGPGQVGRVVVLQAQVKGSRRWITFRKATSRRGGRFGAAYHFTSTTRPTTYRFRALVPRQAGYPWAAGQSRPAAVRVRPRRAARGHR